MDIKYDIVLRCNFTFARHLPIGKRVKTFATTVRLLRYAETRVPPHAGLLLSFFDAEEDRPAPTGSLVSLSSVVEVVRTHQLYCYGSCLSVNAVESLPALQRELAVTGWALSSKDEEQVKRDLKLED